MPRFEARGAVRIGALLVAVTLLALPGGCPGVDTAGVGTPGGGNPAALVGVWRTSFVDPLFGPASVELILQSDGSFQQQTFYTAGSLITIFGTFRVFSSEALLRLDILHGEPSESCGPLGCTPILYPAGESHGFTLNGDGTLTLQNLNCAPGEGGACVLTYGRAV
ncbi:MAG: hypothetical protein AB7Q17_12280 [Phycisphaerae bacterium]